jgi:hypothetical protein
MASTTQYTDFSDLFTGLLNATRNDTGSSATVVQAKRYIGLHDMHVGFGEKFPWSERRSVLITHPAYSEGTLSVATGDTALTGVSTAWNTANDFGVANLRAGGKVRIAGGNEVYEVASVTNDTSATLASDYVPSSDASGASYVYFEDEYALASDFLRPIDQRRLTDGPNPIEIVGRREFRARFPRNGVTGRPWVATIIDIEFSGSTTPRRRLVLHQPPDKAYQIPYSYVTSSLAVSAAGAAQADLSADADEPIVPIRYRHAIVLWALYHWYRDKKDDTRSAEARGEYTDLMIRIAADTEIGAQRASIAPRVASYRARARRPYSRGGGRYDLDGRFDRLEDRS